MNLHVVLGCFVASFLLLCDGAGGATFVVTNSSSTGPGTLRQAILDANALEGSDSITFAIPGSGVKTINLASPLPPVTSPAIIDATTQPGYAGLPLIELNGANAGTASGLRLLAGNSSAGGLCINRFTAQGVEISGPGTNFLWANYIGTDPAGVVARPNTLQGVWINNSFANVVSNNVISGNSDSGLYLMGGGLNEICGNYVGVSASGSARVANGANGITINDSRGNRVGLPGKPANVVSGNSASGIYLSGASAQANVLQGNIVGLGADGVKIIGNTGDGISVMNASGNFIGAGASGRNVISGNNKAGVYLSGASTTNTLEWNYIGTDASGKSAAGNGYAGVTIARATNNLVGPGNVISGNTQDGIYVSTNSAENTVSGNFVGLDESGTKAVANGFNGITVASAYGNVIGPGNVVSGNTFIGVSILDGSANNIASGNLVGTERTGTSAVPNVTAGIAITKSPSNIIGSSAVGTGNVISGNGDSGVFIVGAAARENVLRGNRIGTDLTGTLPLGNYMEGLYLRTGSSNIIEQNLISANGTWGMLLTNTAWNIVRGNTLGTALDRITPLPNSSRSSAGSRFHTIELTDGCRGNSIGGTGSGEGNLIAYSPEYASIYYAGVRIRDGATNNPVLGNSFKGNAGLAVDLGAYLVTPNDECDSDSGANQLQNFPVLTRVISSGGTRVNGTVNARPNSSYRLEFFAAPAGDRFNSGEGELFLGSKVVSTSASCTAAFEAVLSSPVPDGYVVCATATDHHNNTSEFSAPAVAQPGPTLTAATAAEGQLQLSWPASYTGFRLLEAGTLAPPQAWLIVDAQPTLEGQKLVVTIPQVPGQTRFYKLAFE